MKKLFLIPIFAILLLTAASASALFTTPVDGSSTVVVTPQFEIDASVAASQDLTNLEFNISINESGLQVNGPASINYGALSSLSVGDVLWNLTALNAGEYQVTIEANSSEENFTPSVFNLTVGGFAIPNVTVSSSNVNITALSNRTIAIDVTNSGANVTEPVNLTAVIDATLFSVVGCSDACSTSTNGSFTTIAASIATLPENTTHRFTIDIASITTPLVETNSTFFAQVYDTNVFNTITIIPISVFDLEITELFGTEPSPITLLTNNMNVNFSVAVRNSGNDELRNVRTNVYINETHVGLFDADDLDPFTSASTIMSYYFNESGLYEVDANSTSNKDNENLTKTVNIVFNFSDADGDGCYPIANGGTDLNDSYNNASYCVGQPCERSGYNNPTWNENGQCTGKKKSGGGSSSGGSSGGSSNFVATIRSSDGVEDDPVSIKEDENETTVEVELQGEPDERVPTTEYNILANLTYSPQGFNLFKNVGLEFTEGKFYELKMGSANNQEFYLWVNDKSYKFQEGEAFSFGKFIVKTESISPDKISIKVWKQPFWQMTWFWVVIALIIIALVILAVLKLRR